MKAKRKNVGLAPGAAVYVGSKQNKDLVIEVFDYSQDQIIEERTTSISHALSLEHREHVTWINLNGLNNVEEIKELGQHFKLHPLLIEDIVNTGQRPKLDEYDGYVFVVLKMIRYGSDSELVIEHVSFVLGDGYLLTFQESEGDVFDSVRERLRTSKGLVRGMGADYLLYVLVDTVVDHYFILTDDLGEKTSLLEDSLLQLHGDQQLTLKIQGLKRELLRIRKAVYPLREVTRELVNVNPLVVQQKTHVYLQDLQDHVIQVSENVDLYREMVWSLMDLHLSAVSNKMNQVMKTLTIMASIFIPLTFLAGIYGMNFNNMPELTYEYSYFILLGVMAVIFIAMMVYFKRKRWF